MQNLYLISRHILLGEDALKKLLNLIVILLVFNFSMLSVTFAQSKININTANIEELKALNGIGKVRAKRIVEYRQEHGPFRSFDDLKQVRGIKDRIIEANKSRIIFGNEIGQSHYDGQGAYKTTQDAH